MAAKIHRALCFLGLLPPLLAAAPGAAQSVEILRDTWGVPMRIWSATRSAARTGSAA